MAAATAVGPVPYLACSTWSPCAGDVSAAAQSPCVSSDVTTNPNPRVLNHATTPSLRSPLDKRATSYCADPCDITPLCASSGMSPARTVAKLSCETRDLIEHSGVQL